MERSSYEFHIARAARDRYGFGDRLFSVTANVVIVDLAASRDLAHRMNTVRDAADHPDRTVHPGALNAMGIIDEVTHVLLALYRERRDPRAMLDALGWFEARVGRDAFDATLLAFADQFPTTAVYRGFESAGEWLAGETGAIPHRAVALEELITVWLANLNPAFRPFRELFDDDPLAGRTAYRDVGAALRDYFETRPRFGPANQNLIDMLRAPAIASPDSLEGQLAYIRRHWGGLLGDFLQRLLRAMDVLKEEEVAIWLRFHPPGPRRGVAAAGLEAAAFVPSYAGQETETERFSVDEDWMARTVLVAKSAYVWLDQLSRVHGRAITRLDQIPDEELVTLARRGFTALWLIGLWERSRASQRIKRLCGNPEAVASAYSLHDYDIAADLGGAAAYENLRDRARRARHPAGERHGAEPHGHRLALGDRASGAVPVAARQPVPGVSVRGSEPLGRRARRDQDRGSLLRPLRRGGGVPPRRPLDRRHALHLSRQRRHQLSRGTTPRSSTSRGPTSARR